MTIYQNSTALLQKQLTDEQIRNILAPVGFTNWQQAYQSIQRLADHSLEAKAALTQSLPTLLLALSETTMPGRVLVSFERFGQSAPDSSKLLSYLADNPRGFDILFTVFTGSQFLTEILLRHPSYFAQLTDLKQLAQPKPVTLLRQEIQSAIQPLLAQPPDSTTFAAALDALRRFQRYELLRIGTCDLLGLLDLTTVTTQLSLLADSLVQTCLEIAAYHTQTNPQNFTVIAMGKLGGNEVNYSSDIDLIFLAQNNASSYLKLGQLLIETLDKVTSEGFLYRVDMRLRPWGRSGALVYSTEAHLTYLEKNAGLWERQALLKARPIAGNLDIGKQFLSSTAAFIFNTGDVSVRAEIHKLKQLIETQLRKKGRGWGEIKLGQGSIRDVEFVTQYLQLIQGDSPQRSPNTLTALNQMAAANIISADEQRVLTNGYIFLRTVEHHLQLMHYRQTHTLPKDEQALTHLAQRLGFQGVEAGTNFKARYQQRSAAIRAVYQHYLARDDKSAETASHVLPLLTRMPAAYVETFSEVDIEHHARLIERLSPTNLVEVEASQLDDGYWHVIVVGYDYLGALSLICGLLFAHGFNIYDGNVFTYGPNPNKPTPKPTSKSRIKNRTTLKLKLPATPPSQRKIVDVFTVRPVQSGLSLTNIKELWANYTKNLITLTKKLHQGEQRQAQGELARQIAMVLPKNSTATTQLYPVEIEIDNDVSDRHTVLHITSDDTLGFLYEFTNALALTGIDIRRMTVATSSNQVQDILYVTDTHKNKITTPKKQRELRVATVLIKHFTQLLPRSPNPEAALLHFREFIGQLFMRPNWPDEIASLDQPEVLSTLARLLGVSNFLWDDFLRMQHANLFPVIQDVEGLAERKSKTELREELALTLHQTPAGKTRIQALNTFKDREMFRIDMRQIQGHIIEFGQFSAELTDLAETVVEASYQMAAQEMRRPYGLPKLDNGRESPMVVCALGKCGGRELGFASDIELMFIFAGNGKTTGPRVITTNEYYVKLVQDVTQIIQTKLEGIFELDLRLRPYGNGGSMAVSLESFERYFSPEGDAWPYERQALVKLRPIAGNLKFGQQVVRQRDALIFSGEPFDIAAMRAMRERQLRHLVTAGTFNAKFSPGALVDVEYLVQGLQITHGHKDPSLRQPNTHAEMVALAVANIIPAQDYPKLRKAHIFLRRLINALRMVRGNTKDLTVPTPNDKEFGYLARRLNYGHNLTQLQEDLTQHITHVHDINQRLLG